MRYFPAGFSSSQRLTVRVVASFLCITISARAADLELAADPATGAQGSFALEEIRREAISNGFPKPA